MKKYILNEADMVLVRKVHNNPKRHLFYMVDDSRVCVFIKPGEEYYDFWCADKVWNAPDGDNKFHEKDMFLNTRKAETNSWLRMRWWLIKYHYKNISRWKQVYRRQQKRYKQRKKLEAKK